MGSEPCRCKQHNRSSAGILSLCYMAYLPSQGSVFVQKRYCAMQRVQPCWQEWWPEATGKSSCQRLLCWGGGLQGKAGSPGVGDLGQEGAVVLCKSSYEEKGAGWGPAVQEMAAAFQQLCPGLLSWCPCALPHGQEERRLKTCPPSACPIAEGLSNHPSWAQHPGNVRHSVLCGTRWVLPLGTVFLSLVAVWKPTQFVKSDANPSGECLMQLSEGRCGTTLPAPRFPPYTGCSLSVPWQWELGCWQGVGSRASCREPACQAGCFIHALIKRFPLSQSTWT